MYRGPTNNNARSPRGVMVAFSLELYLELSLELSLEPSLELSLTTRGSMTTTIAQVAKCAVDTIEIAWARWHVGNTSATSTHTNAPRLTL